MSGTEFLVIVIGLFIGYWIVSQFGSGNKSDSGQRRATSAADAEERHHRAQSHAEAQRREETEAEERRTRERAEREARESQQRSRAPEPPPPAHWSSILNVTPNADIQEIRRAYKILMSQYHPDKVASLGSELKELSERKTKEINAAYDRALADRGST